MSRSTMSKFTTNTIRPNNPKRDESKLNIFNFSSTNFTHSRLFLVKILKRRKNQRNLKRKTKFYLDADRLFSRSYFFETVSEDRDEVGLALTELGVTATLVLEPILLLSIAFFAGGLGLVGGTAFF